MRSQRPRPAALRQEVEPVDTDALARFLPRWQGVGRGRRGVDAVAEALAVLEGAPLLASALESDILPARVEGYRSSMLDELSTSGEVVWVGSGAVGAKDGRVRLAFRDHLAILPVPDEDPPDSPEHQAILEHLRMTGASFWPDLVGAVPSRRVSCPLADPGPQYR